MKHSSLLARAAAATATLATAFAGTVLMTAPAQAALVETDYGFFTSAFGTTARAEQLGVGSGRTALSIIGCTRLAGKKSTKSLTAADAPDNITTLGIGAVRSTSETFKENGNTGSRSTNVVGSVRIGAANGLSLVIKGLETTSTAWADKDGKFHTSGSFKLSDISANTGIGPVDTLLNQVGVTVGDLVSTILAQADDALVIPGVAKISLGVKSPRMRPTYAEINTVSLKVQLFGPDMASGGGDDVVVVIGRSYAKIYKNMPAGVMGGLAYAADVKMLGGLVGVNELARMPLDCQGTGGKVVSSSTAGADPENPNITDVGAATSRVYGKQFKNGSARAWTESRLTDFNMGTGDTQINLHGVIGRANIFKSHKGKLTKNAEGTRIGSLLVGGDEYDLKDLERELEIPGVATIKFGIVQRNARGIRVTAVRIILVPALAAEMGLGTIDLGVARVKMRRL